MQLQLPFVRRSTVKRQEKRRCVLLLSTHDFHHVALRSTCVVSDPRSQIPGFTFSALVCHNHSYRQLCFGFAAGACFRNGGTLIHPDDSTPLCISSSCKVTPASMVGACCCGKAGTSVRRKGLISSALDMLVPLVGHNLEGLGPFNGMHLLHSAE